MLSIKDLQVSVEEKVILCGLNLEICFGEVYVIMGLNGFGKSMFFVILVGCEDYEVIGGLVMFKGKDLFELLLEEWVGEGIFMVFQYLVEIFGVSNQFFL